MTVRPSAPADVLPDLGAASGEPVRIPPAGPHGGDAAALAAALGCPPDEILDLSVSLNPDAPDVAALAAGHLGALRRYPDPGAATEAMAGALGTAPDRVLLTNGVRWQAHRMRFE